MVDGSSYNVTVAAQPADQTCTVDRGIGMVAAADVSHIGVSCAAAPIPADIPSLGFLSRLILGLLLVLSALKLTRRL